MPHHDFASRRVLSGPHAMSQNTHRLSMEQFLEQDGRTLEEICHAVLFAEENAPALCDEGCEVEPDGTCPHGCPSILRAAGMI
jgi:hypothetical protein